MSKDTAPNFSSILDEAPTEVEKFKPLPIGTYLCTVGQVKYDKSSKKGTDYVQFPLKIVTAYDDVDQDELDELGGCKDRLIFHTFYASEGMGRRLDQFHEHCGLDLSDEASRRQRNDEVLNSEVAVHVVHEPAQNGTDEVYAKVKSTAVPE